MKHIFLKLSFLTQDDGEFVRIRSEIVNSVLAKLKKIYGNASNPGINIYC